MTAPDVALHGRAPTIAPRRGALTGWGGGPPAPVELVDPRTSEELCQLLPRLLERVPAGAIARGLGRSYGDAAQLSGGLVIDVSRLKESELDEREGVATVHAGVTIGELLEAVIDHGWIVPVVPGTQHVTIGGAIASDIHGKNHGTAGTLGRYVRSLGLLTAAGDVLELEPGAEDRLFEATLGGMGLTGVILWARIALRAVSGPLVSVDTDRAESLDHALSLLSEAGGPYRVAWLDLLGRSPCRGVVTRAAHVDDQPKRAGRVTVRARAGRVTVRARATVPSSWPGGLLRPSTVAVFNELRFRRSPRRERGRAMGFGTHMFPLDAVDAWPRLYGRRGFLQYQLAVPPGQEHILSRVIEALRRAGVPCFLAVLKDLGPSNRAPLSFPIEGWTLTLDVPRGAPGLEPALRRCDELVAAAGGRVYLSKDARMGPDALSAMYPRLEEWRAIRDRVDPLGRWKSDLALRTGLVRP